MPDLFGKIAQEWAVITAAPVAFTVVISAACLIVWLAIKWSYQSVLDGKNAEIALLRRQKDDYKDKLSGASPDEAKAKIDDLERRLLLVEPRRLTTEQREAIVRVLSASATPSRVVDVAHDVSCSDGGRYGGEIASTIRRAPGWMIREPAVMGRGIKSPKGLAVVTPDPRNPAEAARLLIRAFSEAGVDFDVLAAPSGRSLMLPDVMVTTLVVG